MFERRVDLLGGVLADSSRRSLIVLVPESCFVEAPFDERRAAGGFAEIAVGQWEDTLPPVDRLVTCVMVVWAVSIFVGMSYLAAII